MKKYISLAFFAITVAGGAQAQEQQGQAAKANIAAIDKSIISGHFEIDKRNEQRGVTEHINVNYSLSPAPFSTILNLQLNTAEPTLLMADITDANGETVVHLQPKMKSHTYNENINISLLAVGEYKINIYSEISAGLHYSISFRKVQVNKN